MARLASGEERWTAWTDFAGQKAADVGGLVVGPDGTAWAAITTGDGPHLARLDAGTSADAGAGDQAGAGAWTLLPAPAESSSTPWAWTLAVDRDGRVWAATLDSGGLYAWDGTDLAAQATAARSPDSAATRGSSAWRPTGAPG